MTTNGGGTLDAGTVIVTDFEPTLPEPSAAETVRVWDPADSVDVLSEKVYPTLGHPALPG
jgi:hypothetical protein